MMLWVSQATEQNKNKTTLRKAGTRKLPRSSRRWVHAISEGRIVVLHAAHAFADRPQCHALRREGCQKGGRIAGLFAQPRRPILRADNHRHPVMNCTDELVGLGRNKGAGA